jgi:hypothetical protein
MRRQGDSRDWDGVEPSQRFDARPAGEGEHCESEAPAIKHLEWFILPEGRDLVRRGERELVSRYGASPSFDQLRKPLLEAMNLPLGFSSAGFEPFKEGHDWFAMRRLSTVHGVLIGRMSDESIDGCEPKLSSTKGLEPRATGVGRQVKVKPPQGRKRASVAFGLHDDELDSAFLIPVAIRR